MTQIQNRLINYLKEYCYGKSNAKTYTELADIFDMDERDFRGFISHIVTNRIAPIGTNSRNGYFYTSNEDEYNECYDELFKRGKKILKRAKGLRLCWSDEKQKIKPKQLEFAGINK